jgi:hypothetical protein
MYTAKLRGQIRLEEEARKEAHDSIALLRKTCDVLAMERANLALEFAVSTFSLGKLQA